MSEEGKNRFWCVDYFNIESDGKILCLLCSDTVVKPKEYS